MFSLARWYYTDGEVLTDLIWTETLDELNFASVRQIIAAMQSTDENCLGYCLTIVFTGLNLFIRNGISLSTLLINVFLFYE